MSSGTLRVDTKRKLAHIFHRAFRQKMASHARLPPDPRFRRQILDATKYMRRKKYRKNRGENMRQLPFCVYSKGPGAHIGHLRALVRQHSQTLTPCWRGEVRRSIKSNALVTKLVTKLVAVQSRCIIDAKGASRRTPRPASGVYTHMHKICCLPHRRRRRALS